MTTRPPSLPAPPADFPPSPEAIPNLPAHPLEFALHFIRYYRGWYLLIFTLEVVASVAATAMSYSIGQVVQVLTHLTLHPELVWKALTPPLLVFTALNLLEVVASRAAGMCRISVAPRLRCRVTQELYTYLQHHSHRFISNNFAGSLAHRVSETSQGVGLSLSALLFDFLPILVKLVAATILLATASLMLGFFVGIWALIFLVVSSILARNCQPHAKNHAAARSETNGKLVDSVTNFSSVRLFARLDFERLYLDQYLKADIAAARVSMSYMEKIHWFQYSASVILKIGVLIFGVYLWQHNRITIGGLVMSISLALLVISEVRNLGRRFIEFFEYVGNIANGVQTLIRPHDVVDKPGAPDLAVTQGVIEFRHVSFGYAAETKVFDDLSLKIEAGQRVGLVGYSGSGKSTLLNLVLRLYEPRAGGIYIDGQDIRDVTQRSLHSQISLIPQDPGLFHRSLLENIRYGRLEADASEIAEAAELAQAHEFIAEMPLAYDSLVGERGVKLSGGQRQRVAIARVIAKNAPILILDEATSSLDSLTEKAIQDSLDTIMRGKTVIVVAHRLSTIAHLDRILVFDKGRIVEDGSHRGLLAQNGFYARLWNRQVNGFIPERESATLPAETSASLPA